MLELLSPAGSFEGFMAALSAGADAVYAGGTQFGARAYASNFTDEEMLKAIDIAHLHDKKLYMTVNTLCKEREFDALYHFIKPFYEEGLDGVIVQDIGVISLLRNTFPGLPIHASTQMTLTGVDGAGCLKELGAARIVPARELSLKEIQLIHETTGLEIEAFIHGAMCYSYSGQCLFSSFLGGRSGNRGRCAQPCRQPYTVYDENTCISTNAEEYVLSMKDLCTLDILPQLIENGVSSFKIEGRMKKSAYTGFVTSIYRKYIDMYLEKGAKGYKVDKADYEALTNAYKRSEPERGYYDKYNSRSLITLKKPSYETSFEADTVDIALAPLPVYGYAYMHPGEPGFLTLTMEDISVTAYGAECAVAQKRAVSEEDIKKQLLKTGDTDFVFAELTIDCAEDLFVPLKSINELRREAFRLLYEELLSKYKRKAKTAVFTDKTAAGESKAEATKYTALAATKEQLLTILSAQNKALFERIYIEASLVLSDKTIRGLMAQNPEQSFHLALPYIFRQMNKDKCMSLFEGFDGYLVRNYEELYYCQKHYPKALLTTDFNLYSFNKYACQELIRAGADILTAPLELNIHELKERGNCAQSELLYYGKIPMMLSAGCVAKTLNLCRKNQQTSRMYLKDRYNAEFDIIRDCTFDTNIILNSVPLYLGSERETIDKTGYAFLRLAFTNESADETKAVLDMLQAQAAAKGSYTKGHFRKSVE